VQRQVDKIKNADVALAKEMRLQEDVKKELGTAQSMLENKEEALSKQEQDLEAERKQLELKEKELQKREKDAVQKELAAVEHMDEMKNLRDQLETERGQFQQLADGRKAELSEMQSQWKDQFTMLQGVVKDIRNERGKAESIVKKDMVAIAEKEKDMQSTVTDINKDQVKLRHEENAILRRVHDLERAEVEFARTKKIFDHKLDEFDEREKQVKEREDMVVRGLRDVEEAQRKLDASYERIKRAKELKLNVALLEKKEQELQQSIEKMSSKLIAISHKMPLVNKRIAPSLALPKPTIEVNEAPKHKTILPNDPKELVQKARAAVEAGDHKLATEFILKAEKAVNRMKKGEARHDLSYDIWDIKTSMRLVTLS
jgi:chromosome segregation ATPase